jgi:hypothetical protein
MINISAVTQEKKQIKNFLESRIQSHFDKNFVDFSKRCRIESDVEKWRDDVVEIYNQNKGKTSRWYSIYFDNEFVLSFPMDKNPEIVEYEFLKNITEMFDNEQVFFDQNEYIIREEIRKLKEKEKLEKIDKVLSSAPKEVKQVIKELDDATAL